MYNVVHFSVSFYLRLPLTLAENPSMVLLKITNKQKNNCTATCMHTLLEQTPLLSQLYHSHTRLMLQFEKVCFEKP